MQKIAAIGLLLGVRVLAQSTCLNFPPGLIPFSSIAYVTAANGAGDHLVVGALTNGLNTLSAIPSPETANQLFCDASVQLAAQQFFPNVYVPSAAERSGNFAAFAGLLVNPTTGAAYPAGIIPSAQLGSVYAFRIGPVQLTTAARGWSPTGSMTFTRSFHAAILLPNQKVLVVGGSGATECELYDPATGIFTQARGIRAQRGTGMTLTLLNDGRVLIIGGNTASASAEIYDPVAGTFTLTGPPTTPRAGHSATLLPDGRVLVVGSSRFATPSDATAAEIYDPKTGTFTRTGSLIGERYYHSETLLPDGRVLIAGGIKSSQAPNTILTTAEIWDPTSGQFSQTGSMSAARAYHNAFLLANKKVLMGAFQRDATMEVYDPGTGAFSIIGELNQKRGFPSNTFLPNGQILIAGGFGPPFLSSTELFNPLTGNSELTGPMADKRDAQTATVLFDGRVLITGGSNGIADLRTAEIYTPVIQGLVTSQTGLTFRAAQGGGAQPSQIVAVLSPTDTIPYNVSVKTFTGGNWLRATPTSGTSGPGVSVNLTITADATGLAASDYYGTVTLAPTDGKHPPVSIAVVLTIVPAGANAAPTVAPAGLVFTSLTGSTPAARTVAISNVTSRALTFTGVATQTTAFFDFTPKTGSIAAGQTQTITVVPAGGVFAAGVYRGSIKLTFGDNTTQTVDVLRVVTASAGTSAGLSSFSEIGRSADGCTPARLLPVLTSIGAGFSTPLGWPTPVIVQVVDNCGTAINTGNVTASFTNGDAPLSLVSIGGGVWSTTWVPVRLVPNTGIRADAQTNTPALSGTVQVSGGVAANPKVPVVAAGGVLSSGDYLGSPAQGLLASIFGLALADGVLGNSSLPLPPQLGSTLVLVSGVQVPMLFVSENQVNVFIPYELGVNAPHQLIVQRGNAISVPTPISVFENQPAILATAGNGAGQGHIYRIDASGAQILADASAPAKAGDVLVIYSVGLGPVNPPLKSGDPAPLTFLERITGTAAVTIGGVPAKVEFAGLTPGFSGLYQINVTVPTGIAAGNQVPVTVSVNGRAGAGSITMALQ